MELIIYNSEYFSDYHDALVALCKFPNATMVDTKDKTLAQITTALNLTGNTYDDIVVCSGYAGVALDTDVITITNGGGNGNIITAYVTIGTVNYPLGVAVSAAAGTDALAILLAANINANTTYHGFSAVRSGATVVVTPPYTYAGSESSLTLGVTYNGTITATLAASWVSTRSCRLGDIAPYHIAGASESVVELLKTANKVTTGTCQAGGNTTTVVLAAGANASDDYYNGMVVTVYKSNALCGASYITDYNGTSKECTVSPAFNTGVAPDATYTYVVSDHIHIAYNTDPDADGNTMYKAENLWTKLFPDYPAPYIVKLLGYHKLMWDAGGASDLRNQAVVAVASGTSVEIGNVMTADLYDSSENGGTVYYLGIRSGPGAGQIRKITANTATTLTLDGTDWVDGRPTAASKVDIGTERELFAADKLTTYLFANMSKITNTYTTTPVAAKTDIVDKFRSMVDKYGSIDKGKTSLMCNMQLIDEAIELGDQSARAVIYYEWND